MEEVFGFGLGLGLGVLVGVLNPDLEEHSLQQVGQEGDNSSSGGQPSSGVKTGERNQVPSSPMGCVETESPYSLLEFHHRTRGCPI